MLFVTKPNCAGATKKEESAGNTFSDFITYFLVPTYLTLFLLKVC